jgi:hypothetical protein
VRQQPRRGIKLKELQAQEPGTSCSPAGRKEAGVNHPSAAYGKALMKQDNKRSTLDPVQPANRHRNVGRQARRILTCHREIRRLWRQRSVKRRLAKKLPPSGFQSGGALWGSRGRFLKRRLAKSGFQSGGALWGSSRHFLKRRRPERPAKRGFRSGGAL